MRVTVSVAGRFHAYHLVEQLAKRGLLQRFITTTLNDTLLPNRTLPASVANDPAFLSRIRRVPLPEYLSYGIRQLPMRNNQPFSYFVKDNLYDRSAVKFIAGGDLFVGWASQSLFQLREAKTRGAKTIVERGSTHISEQYHLIDTERKKFGIPPMAHSRWDRLLEEKQLKEYHEADRIVVPSEFARESFLRRGFDPKKIVKIRYGVDLEQFYPSPENGPREVPTVLFVGAIGFQKGVPYLLEAARRLRQKGSKFRLKLIGRFETDFEQWLKTNSLRSEIDEHLSFVANRELVRHMHAADLFVLPSVQEGLALVVAEAMASGLPVIASEYTGAREFIEDGTNGIIVPPADTDSLAEQIERVLGDHNFARSLGARAAQSAQRFGWESYGTNIERAYRDILDEKGFEKTDSGEVASFYDTYWDRSSGWTPTHSFTQPQLDLHFKGAFHPNDSVLDVGCGDATNYQAWLVKQVRDLKAIDISPSGIAAARRMGIDAREHDLSKPFPFSSNSFEGAVCLEVLEHLYDPKFAVKETFRVLKPGGLFIASVPNNGYFRERLRSLTKAELSTSISDFSNEWNGAHIRFYNLHSFRRLMEVCGFQIESVRSNADASIFDGLDAFGGYAAQHLSSMLRRKLPRLFRLAFLESIWPAMFAPHIILWARKPKEEVE